MSVSDEDDYDFDDLAEFDDEPDPEVEQEILFDPEADDDLAEFDEPVPVPVVMAESAPQTDTVGFSRSNKRPSALVATPATKTSEAIRRPLMSGHCAFPQTHEPDVSHGRCRGYSRANPEGIFQPCPDLCHFPPEQYECSGCGGTIIEAPHYPIDEDGDVRYVHVDMKRKRVTDCECPR